MAVTGVRQWLKDQGYAKNDNEITYDNGNVKLNGRSFINATPQADSKTYADTNDLANAWNTYRANQMQNQQGSLMNAVQQKMTQPQQTYQYDKNTLKNDPQYQAALKAALQSANSAQNNALANLRASGQGKSSYSETVANQIQQGEVGKVNAQLVPQLMAQNYQRWQDQQNANRQQTNDLLGLANVYGNNYQQQFNNDRALSQDALQNKQANLSAANAVGQQLGRVLTPKDDWSNLYNQDNAPKNLQAQQQDTANGQWQQQFDRSGDQWQQQFDRSGDQWNQEYGLKQAQTYANIGNMNADNARQNASLGMQAGNQNLSNLYKIWEYTGQAPEGIPGVEAGTPLASRSSSQKTADPYSYVNELTARYVNKDQSGNQTISNPYGLRQSIISLNLPDSDTIKLLNYYNLPVENPTYSGGR